MLSGFECACQFEELPQGHIGFDGVDNFANDFRNARDNFGRGDFIHASFHESLLTFDAPDVSFRITIAHVSHGGLAVHVLLTGIKVDNQSAVVVPRIFVKHSLFNVDIHAADCVNDFYKAVRVNQNVVVNVNAEKIFNG